MTTQIVVNLPDETFKRAEHLARLTRREIADVVAETVSFSLPEIDTTLLLGRPISSLSDGEVVRLAALQMDANDNQLLSELLYKQQANRLTEMERIKLGQLMQIYQTLLLQKAEALAEAVERGLREPLSG